MRNYYWGFVSHKIGTAQMISASFGGGIRDINLDGDTLDTVMIYSGSVTDTNRPGVTFRLSSQIDNHKLMAGYWYEHSQHRRTQPAVHFNNAGNSVDPWLKNPANYLLRQDGTPYQGRDFLTISTAKSLFLQDSIGLMNDKLNLLLGLRHTGIGRDFTNYASERSNAFYNIQQNYFKTLPSLGARYQLNNEQQIFFNVAENFRAPPDSIYYDLINGGTLSGRVLTGYTMKSVNVTAGQARWNSWAALRGDAAW